MGDASNNYRDVREPFLANMAGAGNNLARLALNEPLTRHNNQTTVLLTTSLALKPTKNSEYADKFILLLHETRVYLFWYGAEGGAEDGLFSAEAEYEAAEEQLRSWFLDTLTLRKYRLLTSVYLTFRLLDAWILVAILLTAFFASTDGGVSQLFRDNWMVLTIVFCEKLTGMLEDSGELWFLARMRLWITIMFYGAYGSIIFLCGHSNDAEVLIVARAAVFVMETLADIVIDFALREDLYAGRIMPLFGDTLATAPCCLRSVLTYVGSVFSGDKRWGATAIASATDGVGGVRVQAFPRLVGTCYAWTPLNVLHIGYWRDKVKRVIGDDTKIRSLMKLAVSRSVSDLGMASQRTSLTTTVGVWPPQDLYDPNRGSTTVGPPVTFGGCAGDVGDSSGGFGISDGGEVGGGCDCGGEWCQGCGGNRAGVTIVSAVGGVNVRSQHRSINAGDGGTTVTRYSYDNGCDGTQHGAEQQQALLPHNDNQQCRHCRQGFESRGGLSLTPRLPCDGGWKCGALTSGKVVGTGGGGDSATNPAVVVDVGDGSTGRWVGGGLLPDCHDMDGDDENMLRGEGGGWEERTLELSAKRCGVVYILLLFIILILLLLPIVLPSVIMGLAFLLWLLLMRVCSQPGGVHYKGEFGVVATSILGELKMPGAY